MGGVGGVVVLGGRLSVCACVCRVCVGGGGLRRRLGGQRGGWGLVLGKGQQALRGMSQLLRGVCVPVLWLLGAHQYLQALG